MTDKLYQYACFVRKILREDWDHWSIFAGPEGVGKSSEAILFGHYVSADRFRISQHVVYTPEDFVAAIEAARPGDTIILDEGGEAWYNLEFQSKVNHALDKMAMMIREKNLNIIICVPYIWYLGKVAIRRHKILASVEAPDYQRGYSEVAKPYWPPYVKAEIPWWDVQFIYYFPDLPPTQKVLYKKLKKEKGEERLAQYKATAQEGATTLTPQEVVRRISRAADKEPYMNRKGYDRYRVMYHFHVPETIARQAVAVLNDSS